MATASTTSPTPQSLFHPFMRLPAEFRIQVYEQHFIQPSCLPRLSSQPDYSLSSAPPSSTDSTPTPHRATSLLGVGVSTKYLTLE